MNLKSLISTAVVSSLLLTTSAFANEDSGRDVTLISALERIAGRNMVPATHRQWSAFQHRINAALITVAGIPVGAGAAAFAYVSADKISGLAKALEINPGTLRRAQELIKSGGPYAAMAVGTFVAVNVLFAARETAEDNELADAHRAEATRNPGIYRSDMAHFFALSVPEQFLIAKKDPQFADDLIQMARSLDEAELAKGGGRTNWVLQKLNVR